MTRTLLYVDDDPDIRTIVRLSLELDGVFTPIVAESGTQALARIAAGLIPDVTVLDVMMPGMDGLALLDLLRQRLPTMPIVFMTARGRENDLALYRARGATGVIVKPFDPVRLGADIRAIVAAAT